LADRLLYNPLCILRSRLENVHPQRFVPYGLNDFDKLPLER